MSLFGKILALLNIFGAVALVVLLIMAYGKRQAFAYSVHRHELLLNGLPLDEKELGPQNRPLVDQLSDKTLSELFGQAGGKPQATQVAEVNRVKTEWTGKVDALGNNTRAQIHLLSRLLLPLADNYIEREEMLACRHYFASDAALKGFKERYKQALDEALARTDRSFEETFHAAMRALGGEPSESFTATVLNGLPVDRAKAKDVNFDAVWNTALTEQLKSMRTRLDARFARAVIGSDLPKGQQGQSQGEQKRTIARLLFSLAIPQAEEEAATDPALQKLPPYSLAYNTALLNTDAYKRELKRVYTVSGMRTTLTAISEEALLARKLAEQASIAQGRDLTAFMMDNAALIADLRQRAELVATEMDRIKENDFKLNEQKMLVTKRMRDVKELQDELAESRKNTDEVVTELRSLTSKLLDERVKVRNAIKEIEELEKQIIQYEATIRAREKSNRRD